MLKTRLCSDCGQPLGDHAFDCRYKRKPKHHLLGPKFNDRERAAYDWLRARDIRPWLVDLATKKVTSPSKTWPGLIAYAQHHGWEG